MSYIDKCNNILVISFANYSSFALGNGRVITVVSCKIHLVSLANYSSFAFDYTQQLSVIIQHSTNNILHKDQGTPCRINMGIGDMNIFSSLRMYAGKWMLKASRGFSAEEINAVASATVVPSQYGNSVCFLMKAGGQTYIPLSQNSSKAVGESIDLSQAKLLTLEKQGEADIYRVEA